MSRYLIPAQDLEVKEEIKKSLFVTRIKNVNVATDAKAFIKQINNSHPDATHHCWAYIVGDPKSTTLVGCSDDGEPSGTAGKPMLHVLQHSDIGDIVVVCTRYFGGTKLGTGGLARAYGGGVKLAIEQLSTKLKVSYTTLCFNLDYHQLKDCEHILKSFDFDDLRIDYLTQIKIRVNIAVEQLISFKQAIDNQFKGKIEWNTTKP